MSAVLAGACLCGALTWEFDGQPESATACNCTACRRYGTLWAYGVQDDTVRVDGHTAHYRRGDDSDFLAFHFCPNCGCIGYWRALEADAEGRRRIAVNLRLARDVNRISAIPIRSFDGLETFSARAAPSRCVADLGF